MRRLPRFTAVGSRTLLGLAAALTLGAALPHSTRDPGRDAPPPPSPTFRSPAGRALFSDDFSDGDLQGWRADEPASWSVRRGVLRADLPDVKQAHSFLYAGDSTWVNYAVDFDVCGMRGVDKGVVVRVQGKRGLGIDLRGPDYHDLKLYINQVSVGSAKVANEDRAWHHIHVDIRGNDCRVTVGGHVVFDQRLRHAAPPRGGIALTAYTGGRGQCTVYYDNIIVTPLAAESRPAPG